MTESSDALGFDDPTATDSEIDRVDGITPAYADAEDTIPTEVPLEADVADTVDQYREVPADEEYPHT